MVMIVLKKDSDRIDQYIAYAEIIGAVLITGFWIGWYLDILKSFAPDDPFYEVYTAFESSFPIADLFIVILLLISAYFLLTQKIQLGIVLSAAAAGALIFLGIIDITFNLQQGVYQYDILAIFINLVAVLGGVLLLTWILFYHSK